MQGPCETGNWLIYNSSLGTEDAVTCESVPDEDCKLDGSQVYYEGQCQTLGSNSVCHDWETLIRDSDDWGIIKCSSESVPNSSWSLGDSVPPIRCPPGTKKTRYNECRLIYTHGILSF